MITLNLDLKEVIYQFCAKNKFHELVYSKYVQP